MEILLSTQILVGESIATRNSWRIPFNQTHRVAAFTVALYLTSAEEREIVCCYLLDQKIGPSTRIKIKPKVYFLLVGSLSQPDS